MSLHPAILLVFTVLWQAIPAIAQTSDGAALSVIGSVPGPDGGWDIASIDDGARRLYVAHGNAVMAVDLDNLKVNPKLVGGQHVHAVLPLPGGRALATNGGSASATLFDLAGHVIATIQTGQNPDAALLDPSSGLAIVMDGKDGDATLIDPNTANAVGRIPLGGKPEFGAADGKGRVYVNLEDKGTIAVVDMAQRKTIGHYDLPSCDEPSGLAIDPSTGLLLSACSNGKAVVLNANDGRIVAELPIAHRPDTAIYDAARKSFFIPCGEGFLAVIAEKDGNAPTVVANIPTAAGARTGALDPKSGRLYLPTADVAAPPPGEARGAMVPGTFRILILGAKSSTSR